MDEHLTGPPLKIKSLLLLLLLLLLLNVHRKIFQTSSYGEGCTSL